MNTVATYGYCPICGAEGITRERCINGNDICVNGHKYPSTHSLKSQLEFNAIAANGGIYPTPPVVQKSYYVAYTFHSDGVRLFLDNDNYKCDGAFDPWHFKKYLKQFHKDDSIVILNVIDVTDQWK